MGKQAIKLKILGKPYSFSIDSEKEELYRLAEREVNNNLVSIRQKNIQGWSEVDYLGMTALKFAIENLDMRQNRELKSDELKAVEALDAEKKAAAEAAKAARSTAAHVRLFKAKLIVPRTLLRIGEHLVGLVDLLEARFGFLVVRVKVRVAGLGCLAVSLLDLIVRGALSYAQHLIVIPFVCHSSHRLSPHTRDAAATK